jgi:hypothetical protein
MTTSEQIRGRGQIPQDGPAASERPVTTLRGAGVDVDPRRAGRAVLAVCLAALAVVAVVLVVAGAEKNDQDTDLHAHGVPVAVTVTGCTGLLGGSGSNAAGYACKGTYVLDGHRYEQSIPGTAILRPGAVVRGVIAPDDPYLLSTPGMLAGQTASWKVFIAPAVLFLVLVLASVALLLRRRRRRSGGPVAPL